MVVVRSSCLSLVVAVEARWTGILAVPLGTLVSGTTIKAAFAMFFQFAALMDGEGKLLFKVQPGDLSAYGFAALVSMTGASLRQAISARLGANMANERR